MLTVTFALGLLFLAVKGLEYGDDISKHMVPGHRFALKDRAAEMFWGFYWLLTGLHAIHMTVGLGLLARLYWLTGTDIDGSALRRNLDAGSLYWHFVDAVWFVIYPTIYLAGRSG
jgi:cytochrome c oxidase subunit 3